mgnify:CR=1 FL=1
MIAQSAYTLDTYITAGIVDHLRLFFIGEKTVKEVYHQFFLLIGIGAITWTFWRINEYAINQFQIQVAKKVYEKVFVHTHHHSSQYFADNFAGAIFKRISRYVRTFEDFSDTIIARILPILVHLGATVIVVFSFSTL